MKLVKVQLFKPLDIEIINEHDVNCIDNIEMNVEINKSCDNIQKQNWKNLKLSHCNKEEYSAI